MGASVSMVASCATSMYTIDYAMRLCDEYDYVVVGSGDANVFLERILYFQAIGALGNTNCPFDNQREGFIMGEGAGCIILQSSKKVKEYNSTIHATLYPCGYASDALDMTSPAQDARGAKIAITKALKNADMHDPMPLFIDAVSAHATSTIIGDPIEYNAITDILGNTPIYAPKSKIGHTIGSAGILETIYAIESMKNRVIPGIQNLNQCSFDDKKCLVKESITLPNMTLKTLNNSFAFGGKCMSQVIEV
jgi:3-oxoacyl-(acyl-carrier-protein) synthase